MDAKTPNRVSTSAILGLIAYFTQDQSPWVFWTLTGLAYLKLWR